MFRKSVVKMVRKYKRKTEKRSADDIVRALQAIEIGTAIRAAARDFGIPERTLRDHWNRNKRTSNAETMDTATSSAAPSIEPSSSISTIPGASTDTVSSTDPIEPIEVQRAPRQFVVRSVGHPTVSVFITKIKLYSFL